MRVACPRSGSPVVTSLGLVLALVPLPVQQQVKVDPYHELLIAYNKEKASFFTLEKVHQAMFAAKAPKADAMIRFKFGALAVRAWDTNAFGYGSMLRYAKDASKLLIQPELKLSPSYCYIVAKLGLISEQIGSKETEAAQIYYSVRKDGISSFVYAKVLIRNKSEEVRAKAVPYALYAQNQQPDSLENRWLVASCYLERSFHTNKKTDWEMTVKSFERTLEMTKEKNQVMSLKNSIRASKGRLAKAKS